MRRVTGSLLWWALFSCAFITTVAWLVGAIVGDRFALTQGLSWIPVELVSISLAALGTAATVCRRSSEVKWACWLGAIGLGLWAVTEDVGFSRRPSDGAFTKVCFVNAQWPGQEAAESVATSLASLTFDLLIVTDAGPRLLPRLNMLAETRGDRLITVGQFAVVTRLEVSGVRTLFADGLSTVAELNAMIGAQSALRVAIFNLPSHWNRPRMLLATNLHRSLSSLGTDSADLAVGDFNMTNGPALAALLPAMRDSFTLAGSGWRGTYPSSLPLWQSDHIFVGSSWECAYSAGITLRGTPHRALEVWVRPKRGPLPR